MITYRANDTRPTLSHVPPFLSTQFPNFSTRFVATSNFSRIYAPSTAPYLIESTSSRDEGRTINAPVRIPAIQFIT